MGKYWERPTHLTAIRAVATAKTMNLRRDPPVFPYEVIWEDFDPLRTIGWEYLRSRAPQYSRVLSFPDIPNLKFSSCKKEVLVRLIKESLGREPSEAIVEKFGLLAGFHLSGQFQKNMRIDLGGQRPVLKRLEQAARELWEVTNAVSAEVRTLILQLHQVEPETLVPKDKTLHISDVLCEAYDIARISERILKQTRPLKTGRRPHFWRDTTVRLAAAAIEEEFGSPIKTSRGNHENPQPHFSNAAGVLLRRFLGLLEPRTDEALIVKSLVRVRKQAGARKNSGECA